MVGPSLDRVKQPLVVSTPGEVQDVWLGDVRQTDSGVALARLFVRRRLSALSMAWTIRATMSGIFPHSSSRHGSTLRW